MPSSPPSGPIRLAASAAQTIRQHIESAYPFEVMGLLAGPGDDTDIVQARPIVHPRGETPRMRHRPSDLLRRRAEEAVHAAGLKVLGTYRSRVDHPPVLPEEALRTTAPDTQLVVEVRGGACADWRAFVRAAPDRFDARRIDILP